MEKIRLIQNAVTITTDLKVDEIKQLQKQNPSALAITEPSPQGGTYEVFRVAYSERAFGEIDSSYMLFVDKNKEGKACLTLLVPADVADKVGYLYDKYATALNFLTVIERNARKALEEHTTSRAAFEGAIVNLDDDLTLAEALEGVEVIINAEATEEVSND